MGKNIGKLKSTQKLLIGQPKAFHWAGTSKVVIVDIWIILCLENQLIYHQKLFFQIATNAKGRGVLRLLLKQHQVNLLCVGGLFLQLFMVVFSSKSMPPLICISYEVVFLVVYNNYIVSHFSVALGRYITKYLFKDQSHQ